ncbi:MAG TPA: hypothetical protein VKU62_12030 [Thermoanaerobaculia bacterium]|nr:hypothetical protein [Thermoanaerobaculia bacterium]
MTDLLRHTLATVAYRGGKVVRGVPPDFANFRSGESTRTPIQILAHIGDVLDWACYLARGQKTWNDSTPQSWDHETQRFFDALQRLDRQLSNEELKCDAGHLFSGPIADVLTHIGQLAILRRMAGVPIRGENYFIADIETGRVGPQQSAPKREFE